MTHRHVRWLIIDHRQDEINEKKKKLNEKQKRQRRNDSDIDDYLLLLDF